MGLLGGIISGLIFGAIAVIIGSIRGSHGFNSELKKCLVKDDDTTIITFELKGNRYDRQKYLEGRIESLSNEFNTEQLQQKLIESIQSKQEKSTDLLDIEIEALRTIMKSK